MCNQVKVAIILILFVFGPIYLQASETDDRVDCSELDQINDSWSFQFSGTALTKLGYTFSPAAPGETTALPKRIPDRESQLTIFEKVEGRCLLRRTVEFKPGTTFLQPSGKVEKGKTRGFVDSQRGFVYLEEPDGRWAALLTVALVEVEASTGKRRTVLSQVIDLFPNPQRDQMAVLHRKPRNSPAEDTKFDDADFILSLIRFIPGKKPTIQRIDSGALFSKCHPDLFPFYFEGKESRDLFRWSPDGRIFSYPADEKGNLKTYKAFVELEEFNNP